MPAGYETSLNRLLFLSTTTICALDESTATLHGVSKLAAEPVPSAKPPLQSLPQPARVETTPDGETRRTRPFAESATTMSPLGSKAAPVGLLNKAPVPVPSENPAIPPAIPRRPAMVVTTPAAETIRIRWLPVSGTTRLPLDGSKTRPTAIGPKFVANCATVPTPSALPGTELPTKVETLPRGVMRRIVLLSATAITPLTGETANADGLEKDASNPVPSFAPMR